MRGRPPRIRNQNGPGGCLKTGMEAMPDFSELSLVSIMTSRGSSLPPGGLTDFGQPHPQVAFGLPVAALGAVGRLGPNLGIGFFRLGRYEPVGEL